MTPREAALAAEVEALQLDLLGWRYEAAELPPEEQLAYAVRKRTGSGGSKPAKREKKRRKKRSRSSSSGSSGVSHDVLFLFFVLRRPLLEGGWVLAGCFHRGPISRKPAGRRQWRWTYGEPVSNVLRIHCDLMLVVGIPPCILTAQRLELHCALLLC